MREITVTKAQAGQRLDRVLERYLPRAERGFLYRMMRKKNITLNDQKAHGNEKLCEGDTIRIWFSEETMNRFTGEADPGPAADTSGLTGRHADQPGELSVSARGPYPVIDLDILYEDDHVVIVSKPAGMLSQKAKPDDISLCEYLIGYLLDKGEITPETLRTFKPSVCNRLDRNTSGIVCCGKTSEGLRTLSELFRDRKVQKYYRCIVAGRVSEPQYLEGYLRKDERLNRVTVLREPSPGARAIATEYTPVFVREDRTCLEVHLLTGRSHQIRAHLASTGHPLLGDEKYGDERINRYWKRQCGVNFQLLHCCRLEMPVMEGAARALSGRKIISPEPAIFRKVMENNGAGYARRKNTGSERIHAGGND